LPQPLIRCESQALQRQGQVNAEIARARGGAAGRRVEQMCLDVSIHACTSFGFGPPPF